MTDIDPSDRDSCERVYAEARSEVEGGLRWLLDDLRPADGYRGLIERQAWETIYDETAPGPEGETLVQKSS